MILLQKFRIKVLFTKIQKVIKIYLKKKKWLGLLKSNFYQFMISLYGPLLFF